MADQWGMNDKIVKTDNFGANDEIDQHNPLRRGWNKMTQSVGITKDLALGDNVGAAQKLADADTYQRQNPGSSEGKGLSEAWRRGDGITGGIKEVGKKFGKDWDESSGFGAIRSVAKNVQAMGSGVLEQTPNMMPPMAGMLAGGAAGSTIPVVGTIAGGWAGATLGNTAVEGGGMTQEALQKANINPQDKVATEAWLKANGDNTLKQAATKGAIIGAMDTLTMGMGHGLLSAPAKSAANRAMVELGINAADKVAVKEASKAIAEKMAVDPIYAASKTGAGNIARNVGAAALEPTGEFAGEYLGQGVATGEWDTKNAFLEAASSVGQGAATFVGQKVYAGMKDVKSTFGAGDEITKPTETPAGDPTAPTTTPSTIDFVPPAPQKKPEWTTELGASAPRINDGTDMPREFDTGGLSIAEGAQPIKASEAMGIDPAAGPLSKAAATAVDTGAHIGTLAQSAQVDATNTIANEAINTPATPDIVNQNNAGAPTFGSAYAQRQASAPAIQSTDILNAEGKPFLTGSSAKKAATDAGEGYRPFKLGEKQFVVRYFEPENATKTIATQASSTPATTEKSSVLDQTTTALQQPKETNGTQTTEAVQAAQERPQAPIAEPLNVPPRTSDAGGADSAVTVPAGNRNIADSGWKMLPQRGKADIPTSPAAVPGAPEAAPKADLGDSIHAKDTAESLAIQPAEPVEPNAENTVNKEDVAIKSEATDAPLAPQIAEAAHEAATSPKNDLPEPTQAQKEAGNYKKGHTTLHGLDISIENPVGSTRSGTDAKGKKWSNTMRHHYGYFKGTVGMDKDHIDTFIGDKPESQKVFVVDQIDPATGKPDEHKVMLGFETLEDAQKAYQANYAKGWKGAKATTETTIDEFKKWLKDGNTKKPFAVPAGLAKMQAVKAKKEAEASTPEAIARQIQLKIAANRRAARVKSREEHAAKGWKPLSTQESEQDDYDKEISLPPMAGNIEIANAILNKDVPTLVNRFVNGSFEASEDVFHKVTGVKIKGLSAANKKAALYEWADFTPAQIADFEKAIADNKAARAEKFKVDESKSAVKWAWNALERLNIKTETGGSINGKEFIQQQVAKGFDEVGTQKKGVATLYGLVNGTKFTTIKNKTFTAFLKAARDFGGLKQALELVAPKAEDDIASDFAPPAAKPIANVVQSAKDSGKMIIANAGSKIEPKTPAVGVSNANAAIKDIVDERLTEPLIARRANPGNMADQSYVARAYIKEGDISVEGVGATRAEALANLSKDADEYLESAKNAKKVDLTPEPGQNDELDSEMRGYEEKAEAEKMGKLDALNEKEKAAKAKMLNALGKLAALASKNTRMNWTPEEEQKLLPIVIELFDGAMELGAVTFQKAVKYVRDYIAQGIDQETADAIPFDTLQGAYIATSGRHKDKGVTPKKEVAGFESLDELAALDNTDKKADIDTEGTQNATPKLDNPSTGTLAGTPTEALQGPEPVGATAVGTEAGSGKDGAGNEATDGPRGDNGRGISSSEGAVSVPTGGKGKQPRSSKKPRVQSDAKPQQGFEFVDTTGGTGELIHVNPAPNAASIPAPAFNDFTIEDDFALGEGGPKAKFRGNVDAIKLLRQLDLDGRAASPSEQSILAKYVGWGGLAQAFDENNESWSKEYSELKSLMGDKEYADAKVSTRYAHYTSRQIIQDGIYAALKHMGFTGGRALEGGAGVGNFIGLMPADMRSASRFTAIEREPFSAKLAKHLYPQQNIQEADFTEFVGNDDFYDVAVGNPPFASDTQVDRSGRKHLSGLSLHNYFFAKEVDMLREGGILAQVVTNSFLDAMTDTARSYISERTKFLGAIRLPNNAFSKNAGTEVTTDLIFLQKRPESEWGSKASKAEAKAWIAIGKYVDSGGKTVALNQYFIDNPDMMLGDFGAFGTMYRPDATALVAKPGQNTGELLKSAVSKLPANIYIDKSISNTSNMQDALVKTLQNPTVQEGGYFEDDGKLFQRIKDIAGEARAKEITPLTQWTEKTKLGDAGFLRIKALSAMRVTVRSLLAAELSGNPIMDDLRKTLNIQYDAYSKEFGLINDSGTLRVFDDDPDFPLLASLEHGYTPPIGIAAAKSMGIKPVPSKANKGPIFTQRVIDARQQVSKVETPADALAVSMAERGKIDAKYIGELLGRDSDEVLSELASGDKPLLFQDPANGDYALRDAYLSGNVRAKLVQAKQAGMFNNIKALEDVQPEDVGSHEIDARIGSPWVPESVYQDFAVSLLGDGTNASIKYVKATAGYSAYITAGSNVANTNTWGVASYPATDILSALLNNKPIRVTYKDADGNLKTDLAETEKADSKAQDMRDRFQDWLFSDSDRSELLGRAYNDTNNNYVTRAFDGEWMTFPGKVPDNVVKLRRHQRNAISRIVQDRTALLDHVVGSGKTYTVIASAMELRRTGLARKPMIAVPNHLVKQWASDFYKLYPGANILTATKKDFEKLNRRKFLAKIATGDWDAVIIAHSSYGFIKPSPDFEYKFNQKQVKAIMDTIKEVESGDGEKQQKRRTVKQLEGIKERLENRIKSLRDKPMDALLDFGELGIDQLFVDEAHMFKNLMFSTKMQNIAGLGDAKGSQRAYDMFVKANQIYDQNGRGQGVVFATGTPVSNSLAEMYHMMRYLMPAQMEEMGFQSFDAWANTYAQVEQVWMQKASSDGFKAQNRMSNFVNTNELLKVFDQVADTVTMEDIKAAYRDENKGAEFPLPKLKGEKRTPVSLVKSVAQSEYMAKIAERALIVEQRKGPPEKGQDNILVIMSDARKAAMDIRLVDHTITEREPGGRIDRASDEIFTRYQKFNDVKGTQLVFSDLGTPLKSAKKELKEYQELKDRIEAGATEEVMQLAALGDEGAQDKVDDAEDAQAELDSKGRDWLGAVQSAERGFSVYDDLKAALMEKGIPENEIAFIHDYNTDEQKAGLFRKMNAGQIRVLMGSTPKLGAGTNVQDRLVALHHLDVPWKPSDVEQREGRIVRQGNLISMPPFINGKQNPLHIPGFEVEVMAYVTQDTLDMRMWQVQEAKLKMINQLRTRKIGRNIENAFEDLELSAGEMQAAATGNMDLLREIQIKGEIKKLEQRKRAYDAQKSDLQNRRKSVAAKLESLPEKIASSKIMADASDEYRAELADNAKKFSVTIDGIEYTNRKDASDILVARHNDHVYMRRQEDGKFGGRQLTSEEVGKEPTQDPSASDYNPWVRRPVPLSVNMNGTVYTSRDKLAEAASNELGDISPVSWKIDGKTIIRRALIQPAIDSLVSEAITEESVRSLGSIGPFQITVEGQTDKRGSSLEVVLSYSGQTISNSISTAHLTGENVFDGVREITKRIATSMVENMAEGARQQYDYQKRQFEQAKRDQKELESIKDTGEWPEQGRMEDLRAKHKEVLQRLSGAGVKVTSDGDTLDGAMGEPNSAGNDADVVFSRAQTKTPTFKAWFGDSKVVDADGKPLVVYHGTNADFNEFDLSKFGLTDAGWFGKGFYFTNDQAVAGRYGKVKSVFLRIEKPMPADETAFGAATVKQIIAETKRLDPKFSPKDWLADDLARGKSALDQLENMYRAGAEPSKVLQAVTDVTGFDGVVSKGIYIAFNSTQIKSATGNNGNFDASNPDIRYSNSKSSVLSKNGKFKGWPKFNEWTRAEYNDVVNLLPKEYREDSHRREPIAAEDWDALATAVIPKLQEINQGKASFSLDKIGNILVNAQDVDISTILGKAKDIADQHDIGIYVTGNLKHHIAQLQQAGFESELGLAAVLQRAANTVYAPMPKPNIVRDGVGAIMSYKPRGFSQVLFTRFQQEQKVSGLPASKVQSIVDTLKSKWAAAPDIVVATTMDDAAIPQSVRDYNDAQLSQGAIGAPEGFFYGGKVYLIADQLPTAKDVHRVLFHETLGHVGLRGAFGESLTPILKQISVMRKAEVTAKAIEYGLVRTDKDGNPVVDVKTASYEEVWAAMDDSHKQTAAEEVLAVMAQTKPELGFVKRAIAAIRNWLRTHGIVNFSVSDNDIIANYILPARRFVEAGTKTKINETGLLNSLKAGNWYSELSRQVMASKTNAMPAGMWAGWIGSLTKKGVKPDEIEWSGVQDWLKMQTGKVTKDDVMNYLDQNGVQVEETVLGDNEKEKEIQQERVRLESMTDDAFAKEAERYGYYDHHLESKSRELVTDEIIVEIGDVYHRQKATISSTKYSQYTLPGGTNYREVLLTLPRRETTTGDVAKRLFDKPMANLSEEERGQVADEMRRIGDAKNSDYKSSHWDKPNVLAHIRLNDRTDADGNKVLFVEEIQSDWGQDGKKKGFKAEIEKKFSDLLDKRAAARGAERDAIQEQIDVMGRGGIGVPTAPFVTATDKWLSLALKRVVKIAVDGGYDRVAFVNGTQSAERYALSSAVDTINWRKNGVSAGKIVTIETERGNIFTLFANGDGLVGRVDAKASGFENLKGQNLTEIVGKDFAKKILDEDGGDVSGKGLDIGGEGMKKFYDAIVPNTAKDVIRKLGGGAMESISIITSEPNADAFEVVLPNGKVIKSTDSRKSAEATAKSFDGAIVREINTAARPQPGFTITEAMKEKASGGMPLFARESAKQTESAAFKKWFGDSKVVDADGKPLVMYHGTSVSFDVFNPQASPASEGSKRGVIFLTSSPKWASEYALGGKINGGNVMPVYVKAENPFDFENAEHIELLEKYEKKNRYTERAITAYLGVKTGNWEYIEDRNVQKFIKSEGFDGFYVMEHGNKGLGIYSPTQIKSATGNNGAFNASNPDIRFSRTDDLLSAYTPEQIKEKQAQEAEALKRESETVKAPQKKVTADQVDLFNPQGALFSRATTAELKKAATDKLNEHFSAPGKLSWWHKSIGTMYNLAERSPEFKPVFDAAQGFINDVSYYATEAADMAPKILPKMENWRDLAKSPISATDNKAISAPIFEGTLTWARDEAGKPVKLTELEARYANMTTEEKGKMLLKKRIVTEGQLKKWMASPLDIYDGAVRNRFESAFLKAGVVWSDAELKSIFNQTPEQISLYKEFRAATDKSLDNMAKAEMLRFGGDDIVGLKDAVMDAKDADEAGMLLRDYLLGLAEVDTARKDALMESANGMVERADKVNKLKAEGYAPLSRFGKYSIDVVVDGERQYFGLHETIHEANKMAAKMRAEFGAANVSQGTLSEDQFKMFSGITPETLELFGNMLGFDSTGSEAQDKAFQTYLKLTKNNNSAMRRLIHRKGIMGFSEDAGRVLASFVYSNARNTSAALNMGNLGEAVNNIPKNQGELKDAAIGLAEYIKNPQEEAQAIRGLLFAQYLGGSIASAFVNLTQPFAVSFPWLSQFGGAAQSGSQLVKAMKDMANKSTVYEPDLVKALKHAEESGIVSPQEIHQLMAQARGAGTLRPGDGTKVGDAYAKAANTMSKLSLGWGKVFGMAEQLNRRSTFIAAYRIAKAQNMANPAAFAEKAVDETQFVYSKASKMRFGRGAVGGTLMTFKTYSIAYLELLHRMYTQGGPEGKKAVLLAMGVMMLMSGAGGLPFEDDILDLIDGALQKLGYNINSKKAKQQYLEDLFGQAGADFVERGISGLPGMPLDVSGRLGMGNLIPGTGLFKQKTDHTRDYTEMVGPIGDLAKRGVSSAGKLFSGDVKGAALEILPTAARNWEKSADMAMYDQYRDAKGYKVIETTPLEAALKFVGFQPATVARVQESSWITQQTKDFYNQRTADIRAKWAKGIAEKDPEQVKSAREEMASWNEKNPDQKMSANLPAIWKKVREMQKTKEQRLIDTAPKAMRMQLKRDLASA